MVDDDRQRADRQREMALVERQRSEQAKLMRSERLRQDAIGIASHILDARITSAEAVQPALIGFAMVATTSGDALSPYEHGPIRDALLIRSMGGVVEKAQYSLVSVRDKQIETMMTDTNLQNALHKYSQFDIEVGDRPVEMTGEEYEVFGKYWVVKEERQAIVDRMTNGLAGLYDDREELQSRISKLEIRLENLESRAGSLTQEEKEQYETLLTKMFGELKGAEAMTYSRWAGKDRSELTPEENVMLNDIWEKMMSALDGGEESEMEDLVARKVRVLGPQEKKLYDAQLASLREVAVDKDEFDRLISIPYYKISDADKGELEATLQMVAQESETSKGNLDMFLRLKARSESVDRLGQLTKKKADVGLTRGERGVFESLRERAGTLTEAQQDSIETIEELRDNLKGKLDDINKNILLKSKEEVSGESLKWLNMAKAFGAIVDNIAVTDQWMKAWNDLDAAADLFTKTNWVEFQRPDQMVALMDMPGVGQAFKVAFSAMCKIGLNRTEQVPGSENIMQMKDKTQETVDKKFLGPVKEYVLAQLGGKVPELYVDFGVAMAQSFMENSFAAGWLCVARDRDGNIIYATTGRADTGFGSEPYKYGVPIKFGNGSVRADWDPDYKKIAAIRAKLLEDFAKRFEIGLPALIPVLPDYLAQPWVSHKDLVAIADNPERLREVFVEKEGNSRLAFMHKIYRSAQIYGMVSKLPVGLKGFRSVGEEVLFFMQSPSNLGGLSKKIDLAVGSDDPDSHNYENTRLRANFALALLYAVYEKNANPNKSGERKTVLAKRGEGSITDTVFKAAIGEVKNDIGDLFVDRSDFVSQAVWDVIWNRFKPINPGEGGKYGVGMIKKGEAEAVLRSILVSPAETMRRRRTELVLNV